MGKINVTKLQRELDAAGIPTCGCCSDGRIDFLPEATDAQRKLAEKILAAHDSYDPAETDRETDRAIGAALHPLSPRGEESAIHREQLQAILAELGMKPTEKFARLAEIADKAVAIGQEAKAVTKAG